MNRRIICPHCHCPIDPLILEVAVSAKAQYRICPECDEPIVLAVDREDDGLPASPEDELPPESDSTRFMQGDTSPDQEQVYA
jgi:hypothetical protein